MAVNSKLTMVNVRMNQKEVEALDMLVKVMQDYRTRQHFTLQSNYTNKNLTNLTGQTVRHYSPNRSDVMRLSMIYLLEQGLKTYEEKQGINLFNHSKIKQHDEETV